MFEPAASAAPAGRCAACRRHQPAQHPDGQCDHRESPRTLGAGRLGRSAGLGGRPRQRALAGAAARLREAGVRLGRAVRAGARGRRAGVQRRRGPRLAAAAVAAVPGGVARRCTGGPDHRLLRAVDSSGANATRRVSRAAVRRAGRSGDPQALLDAPADRLAARRAAELSRPRHCLRGRPAGCADPADPGLGASGHHGAGRCEKTDPRCVRRPQRPPVQIDRPLADRPGRAHVGASLVAGHQGLGAAQSKAAQRDAVGESAHRVLP